MSLIRLTKDQFEHFTLVTNPRRTYVSSSLGITGSAELYARGSSFVKDVTPLGVTGSVGFDDSRLDILLEDVRQAMSASIGAGGSDTSGALELYMTGVAMTPPSALSSKTLGATRFVPPTSFGSGTLKKSAVIDRLMPYYRSKYPEANYAFTNYHCLNFFTASSVPADSVLIYPGLGMVDDEVARPYIPTGPFTVDFYINPRYTTLKEEDEFHAGTIIHLSSSLAVSLVSGSLVDVQGRPKGFRILLQLSHSADTSPSAIDLSVANDAGDFPNDLVFLSHDNSLVQNTWNHVSIRWGTSTRNAGSGSFTINGVERGTFNVPSASIGTTTNNDALFVGNFYVGTNDRNDGSHIRDFFNATARTTENPGGGEGITYTTGTLDPVNASFTHPLNAEIHDLKVFSKYRSSDQVLTSSTVGPDDMTDLLFYLPPFFVRQSRSRIYPVSPFQTRTDETFDPFNVEYSFGVGGHLIHLEHFTREFVNGWYPRLFNLTASTVAGSVTAGLTANAYLYATASIRKRNLTVLPCDNGLFVPNFRLLASSSVSASAPSEGVKAVSGSAIEKYVSDLGAFNPRLVTLRDLVSTGTLRAATSGTFDADVEGPTPENLDRAIGDTLAVFQRTRDNTSNQVVFFDISNMLFGRRIMGNTLKMTDNDLTGSNMRVGVTLRDNGEGSLYRADADTKHATWSSVGNVFYNEGLVVVKDPTLPLYSQDYVSMSFQGERQLHIMRINAPCPAGAINSSSNPEYLPISASLNANDSDPKFVYITGLAFHDDNLNVVMRTKLSQPVVKRTGDRILFKTRIDF